MGVQNLVFIAVMIGAFYFLVIRPQQTRARKQQELIAALKAGDEVVTIGGIYATVVSVDDRVRVAVADGTELEVAPQAIAQTIEPAEDAEEPSGDEADQPAALEESDAQADGDDTDETAAPMPSSRSTDM